MVDGVMAKLQYIDPPKYGTYGRYREYLQKSTHYACAYCTISESEAPGATFNIEHFRPRKYFPDLSTECDNLRYSCPRCNSYKGDSWISEETGCSRNCKECSRHVCQENIPRFIDPMKEDPSKVIFLGEDDRLHAYADSKPANYTIEYLRLNRAQLIKLRHVRRFMDSWLEELESKRKKAEKSLNEIQTKQQHFCNAIKNASGQNSPYQDVVSTMYEMMATQAEQSLLFINEEIRKLNTLINLRSGCDEKIIDDK